ncbi:hypothetical protein MTR_5g032650 [Medicago truncatula]|uniref:Uncharacterized protein n=1 Tax=Medicago truncatula TaxID=3880 RepID=G7JXR6_MEDTR|nr:hypothetical protein MTR_5g032650 [Medicago truncatula]
MVVVMMQWMGVDEEFDYTQELNSHLLGEYLPFRLFEVSFPFSPRYSTSFRTVSQNDVLESPSFIFGGRSK